MNITITVAFCAAIVVLAAWTIIQVLMARAKAIDRVNGVRKVLDFPGEIEVQHRSLMLHTARDQGGDVAHLWREFDETLVHSRVGTLLNTHDADHHFRAESLAPELVNNRVLLTRPAVLTVIGVLGTFTGLVYGLSGIDIDADTDQLTDGVRDLINGAGVAFMTSLVGVLFSILTQAVEKSVSREITGKIRGLQNVIDERFRKQTPEASLVTIMHSTEASQDHLASLGEQIGKSLQEAVGPAMDRIADQAARQSEEVFERLVVQFEKSFKDLGTSLAERLDASSATLTQTIEYLGDKLAEQADEHFLRMSEIREATKQQVDLLGKHLPEVVERLDEATARLDGVSEHLAPAAENLRATSEAFEATSSKFGSVLTDSVESLDRITEQQALATGNITTLTEQLGTLTATAVDASATLSSASATLGEGLSGINEQQERLLSSMREQQDSFLEGLRTHQAEVLSRLGTEVDGFRDSLSTWFTAYAESVERHTQERMDSWNEHTHAYTSSMLDAAKALSATVEEIDHALQQRGGESTQAAA